jgi:2-oxoglutarate dehydrogenase E2 component (dihydrolipoamide succinyltransferase)
MSSEILTPVLPESVADATVVTWHKKVGDAVKLDEVLVEVETDKVVLEVPAAVAGVLAEISQPEGSTVTSGQLLGKIEAGAVATPSAPAPEAAAPQAAAPAATTEAKAGPAARKAMEEAGVNRADINGSGKDGRILKEDVPAAKPAAPAPAAATPAPVAPKAPVVPTGNRAENRVPMTRLRLC